jgi:malate dehydrogenase (oxaloacetate-decarboxylating)
VERDGRVHRIGQANNAFIFPGMGLGVTAVRAREVTDAMFFAAAVALSEHTKDELVEQGQIYPDIDEVRSVALAVAVAIARTAIEDGVADPVDDLENAIRDQMWEPEYLEMRPA